jgi:hypothetical protein
LTVEELLNAVLDACVKILIGWINVNIRKTFLSKFIKMTGTFYFENWKLIV